MRPKKVNPHEFPEECIFKVMVNDKQFTEVRDYENKVLYLHHGGYSKKTRGIASGAVLGAAAVSVALSWSIWPIPIGIIAGGVLPFVLKGKTVDFRFKRPGSADNAYFMVDCVDASQRIVNIKWTNIKDDPMYWLCKNDCVTSCGSDPDKYPPSKFVLETVPQSV